MKKNPEQDLEHIRSMMERSSRFISLSGLSGVFAGIFALIAAVIAFLLFQKNGIDNFTGNGVYPGKLVRQLCILGLLTLLAALGSAIIFTLRKSRQNKIKPWNSLTRRLITSFIIPFLAGGIFCIALFYNLQYAFIAPVMLIFYGLALINTSKYTYTDINYLGYCELVLGLIALFLPDFGLVFWAVGFGVMHIVYGLLMYKKYR